jgi:hypothetical protein
MSSFFYQLCTCFTCVLICMLAAGCKTAPCQLEPKIVYCPTERHISSLPSAFDRLSKEDLRQEWAKELFIGLNFADEMDLYRAITAFKRALIILPKSKAERRSQIEYNILLCYYLGQKYQEALVYYSSTSLDSVSNEFPSYRDLLILLFDCYRRTGQEERAELTREMLDAFDPAAAEQLLLSTAFTTGDLCFMEQFAASETCNVPMQDAVTDFLNTYSTEKLSVSKAKTLNALLPGAGYYYVGQKNAAITSFIINGLFTWATYAFIKNGYTAAGLITASLETGWYIGGINGAGLAANEYNERLYEKTAKEAMIQNRLFPVLMFHKSF